MASQVSHIVYAKKYFDILESKGNGNFSGGEGVSALPEKFDKDQFILGCVFPDIRRIDQDVKRKDTHLRFGLLDLDFSGLSSFEAGWKFHLYCDMRREEILNKYGFYSLKGATEFACGVAKLLEDELLYGVYNNWEKIVFYFRNAPFIETGINVSQETFSLWYAILAKYLEDDPTTRTIRVFMSKQSGVSERAEAIAAAVDELRKNKKAVEILLKVKDEIV